MSKSRNWVFTINNPDTDVCVVGEGPLDSLLREQSNVRYAVYQLERGNDSNVVHAQGYLVLSSPRGHRWVCDTLGGRAHVEPRRGTHAEAKAYCTKADTRQEGPWEIGIEPAPEQGKRTDLETIKRKLDEGKSELTVAEEHFGSWCRYNKAFERYRQLKAPKRTFVPQVVLYIGPPGVGKSMSVRQNSPDAYWKQPGTAWYDLYDGVSDIVLDDFSGQMPMIDLLRLLDAYPLLLQVKGGQVNCGAKRIWITSNIEPKDWYKSEVWRKHPFEALRRRISQVYLWSDYSQTFLLTGKESLGTPVMGETQPGIE